MLRHICSTCGHARFPGPELKFARGIGHFGGSMACKNPDCGCERYAEDHEEASTVFQDCPRCGETRFRLAHWGPGRLLHRKGRSILCADGGSPGV